MSKLELKTSGRQFRRQFLAAIRGNLIRALTELITNSDDSYRRLEAHPGAARGPDFGAILINYDRKRRILSVTDFAEGMDARDMNKTIPSYGAATSGLYQDQSVRGYFGKGLKDVLFSMQSGRVEAIKDNWLARARFYWRENTPTIEIDDGVEHVTPAIRERLGIARGNGTRVTFEIPASMNLPRHDSLLRNLSNYYMLRLINANEQRRILLRTNNGKSAARPAGTSEESRVRYQFPAGAQVLEDRFELGYAGRAFPIAFKLYRADMPLTQSGDEREGGILIYDENHAVLDLTLFGFDRDDQAAHLFGRMQISGFRALLKADENVLTDTRDGLDRHQPFTQALVEQVEERLRPIVERERHLRLQNTPTQLSKKQHRRLGQSIDQINALLGGLTDVRVEPGAAAVSSLEVPPENGMEFRPRQIFLCPRVKTPVRLRLDSSQVEAGALVEIRVENGGISAAPGSFSLPEVPGSLVVTQYVVLYGDKEGQQARITAQAGRFRAEIEAEVSPEEYPMPEGGLAFVPDVLRLGNNARRKAALYVHQSAAQAGDKITFRVDNPQFELSFEQITLQPGDFHKGIARVDLPVRGAGIGEQATVAARVGEAQAALFARVVSLRERHDSGARLVTGYRFDRVTPSRSRASYDQETGLIWIYLRNPIVERYFGDLPLDVALNTPHCQILLAEIILEQVAWVARRRMIETGADMYVSEDHTEEDLDAVRRFMAEYGEKIHSWIADDRIIAQVVENISHDISVQNALASGAQPAPSGAEPLPDFADQWDIAVPVTGGNEHRRGLWAWIKHLIGGMLHRGHPG